jgi:hypothetical protein
MADITVTPANVEQGPGAVVLHGRAAVDLLAGQSLYRLSDGTLGLADCDNASAIVRKPAGVALHSCAAGQPIAYQTAGRMFIGATVVKGTIYVLSGTAGGICPAADLASGDEVGILGVGFDADELQLHIVPSGVVV